MEKLLAELDLRFGEWTILDCEIYGQALNFTYGIKSYASSKPKLVEILENYGFHPTKQDAPFSFRMHTTEHGMKGIDNYTTLYVVREAMVSPERATDIIEREKERRTQNTMRYNSCVGQSLGYKCYPL
jgi:hypothetical protein